MECKRLEWIGIVIVIVGLGALNAIAFDLAKQADGMILKPQKDVGSTWMDIVLDEDLDSFSLYWLGLCGGLGLFLVVARWLVSNFNVRQYKVLFVAWLTLQAKRCMCVCCSYILGATQTVSEYPVVAFSNSTQLLGKDVIPILIGQDDKQFAILLAYSCTSPSNLTNTVLYLPRSEVKWMVVVRQEPLHLYAHLRELAQQASHAAWPVSDIRQFVTFVNSAEINAERPALSSSGWLDRLQRSKFRRTQILRRSFLKNFLHITTTVQNGDYLEWSGFGAVGDSVPNRYWEESDRDYRRDPFGFR